MRKRKFGNTKLEVTPVGLGTWVFGGWPWKETDEKECEKALEAALELGVNLVDTAPVYGFGRAETIVGRVLKRTGLREKVVLATKFGLCWSGEKQKKIWADISRKNLLREIDESLKRLQTDRVDIYQIHWPDVKNPLSATMETLARLKEEGKIGVIGVSNFNVSQMKEAIRHAPVESLQPPYNYFNRDVEKEILPFCVEKNIGTLTYGTLCKGLLTGKFGADNRPKDTVRSGSWDPVFSDAHYGDSLREVDKLKKKAAEEGLTVGEWAIRWTLEQPGVTCALVGARNANQVRENFSRLNLPGEPR